MTTYSKRRGRRSLAAILAAMLIASVLAVVAGSPAQAANTASEVLFDHDGDPKTAAVRQFAGATRYETALALAKDFAEKNGGIGGVPVAFVASGESLIDAVAVSALAGDLNAPVLLTPGAELNNGVKDYVEDYAVTTIYVLGGPAAVSDDVVTALGNTEVGDDGPTVTRISGDDRYATAAAIASKLNSTRFWCNGDAKAAVLVNGGDTSLAGATVIGPLTNRLAVPVLLTAADELSGATRDWIGDNDIEHVVVVGSNADVSEGIEKMLTADGVDTVERIGGDSAGELSVNVAKTITGDCATDLTPVAMDQAALVNGWGRDISPDAITASPVLSYSNLVPILLVGDTLPSSVSDYLAATPAELEGQKVHYKLLAIGGSAAVSPEVMAKALAAAAAGDAFSVQITNTQHDPKHKDYGKAPMPDDRYFTLRFSDGIARVGAGATEQDANILAWLRDIVEINGAPASIAAVGATDATAPNQSSYDCESAFVTVDLGENNSLKAGWKISVAGSALKIGAGGDQRTVVPASVTVPKLPTDTTGPKITGIAVEDETANAVGSVFLTVSSEAGSPLASGTGTQIVVDVADPAADFKREAYVIRSNVANPLLSANIDIALVAETNSQTQELTLANSGEWKAGDQIVINRGALRDDDNNPSPQARITVSGARKSPTVSAVNVSNENHVAQAVDGVPGALTADSSGAAQEDQIKISAKKDGPAGGVHGNGWTVTVRTASSWKSAGDADISVGVDEAGRRVVVTIRNGIPTWGQLKAALDGNSAFAKRFDVELAKTAPDTAGVCPKPNSEAKLTIAATGIAVDGGTATLAGGVTTVAVEVQFNGYIKALTGDVLRDAVFAGAVKRHANAITDLQITTISAVASGAPFRTVRYEITANEGDAAALPKPGSGNDQVQADAAAAADGYAANVGTTDADESKNGKINRYMTRSSAVKAPATAAN